MAYFEDNKPTFMLDVLGTTYAVYMDVSTRDDDYLKECDGYCDKTAKRIVVSGPDGDNQLADWSVYEKTNLRHEIIHAFLFESGLDGNSCWGNGQDDHPEQMVQWIALQFPKLLKAFSLVRAL